MCFCAWEFNRPKPSYINFKFNRIVMKKIIKLCIILLTFTCLLNSCKKEVVEVKNIDNKAEDLIHRINNFTPEIKSIGVTYKNYVNYLESLKEQKSSFEDQRIDTSLWNMETYLNNNYGFRDTNTCYKFTDIMDTVSFNIKDYSDGIPIIDGSELNTFFTDLQTEYSIENSDTDNEYFWCNIIEVDHIADGKAYVVVRSVTVYYYYGVYPPGWNPNNFPDYTCMKAAEYGDCDGKYWRGAHNEYEWRYELHAAQTNVHYIYVYYNMFWKTPLTYGVFPGELWEINYNWPGYVLNTSLPADELNSYLQSTKDLIDRFNPNGNSDMYLGNLDVVYYSQNTVPPYCFSHAVEFYIYRRYYIANPD